MTLGSILAALACGLVLGQAGGEKLKFEVASVRPAAPQANGMVAFRGGPGTPDPGRITYINVTLKAVIANAYAVESDQVAGPGWLDSLRYDIDATVPAGATKEQFQVMLQNLVAERFHVAFHRMTKDFVMWELTVAKNGPKRKPSSEGAGGRGPVDSDGFPLPPLHQTAQRATNGVAKMAGNQITMAALAQFLRFPMAFVDGGPGTTGFATARVVDKTGLAGEYDLTLEYEWPGPSPPGADPDGAPSIFTAVQEQLGLRLEKTKQALEVLVVDQAEKTPVEN